MTLRFVDYVFMIIILFMLVVIASLSRHFKDYDYQMQMDRNYVANLNECRTKTVLDDWKFEVSGINDILKEKYPNATDWSK